MLWPFCPLDGMLEGMEFKTDVLQAYSDEQRIRLKDTPWRTFSHSYNWTHRQYEKARSMMRGRHPGAFDLPDWPMGSAVSASSGASAIVFDNTYPTLDVGDAVAVIQSCDQYQELTITAADAFGITLQFPLAQSYTNARLVPLLEANAAEGLPANRSVQPIVSAQAEWRTYSGPDIADAGSHPTYRTYPVLTQAACIGDGQMGETVLTPFDTVDNGLARPFFDTTRGQPRQTLGAAWQPHSRLDRYTLRQWLYWLRGRQRAFWLPGWNRGIELLATITNGGSTVVIRNIGFSDGYGSGDLFIRTRTGQVYTLQVSGSVADTDGITETLTLASPSPATITSANVDQACLMFLVRLASDRIEFEHRSVVGPRVVVSCEEVPA